MPTTQQRTRPFPSIPSGLKWILGFIGLAVLAVILHSAFSSWVDSEGFRSLISRQASKALKVNGEFKPISQTGFLGAQTEGFDGDSGDRTIKAIEANWIKGTFNPLGLIYWRWQIDDIHLESGKVALQKAEQKAESEENKPWYRWFMPTRIHLSEIRVDSADCVWQLRGRESGIYGLQLDVKPNGRDFEYWGSSGELRMSKVPKYEVLEIHTLITKPRMYLYKATLSPPDSKSGRIEIQGEAGLQEDRGIQANASLDDIPIAPWLSGRWNDSFSGTVSGQIHCRAQGTKLEGAQASGDFNISSGSIKNLPILNKLASLSGHPSLRTLDLNQCSFGFQMSYPDFEAQKLVVESKGIFRLNGDVRVDNRKLSGQCRLGIAPTYLEWMGEARSKVFTKTEGGYHWTDIRLSGTIDNPHQDLSPRIEEAIKESPGVLLGLFFKHVGDWFSGLFD
jgi:hypothetical protein